MPKYTSKKKEQAIRPVPWIMGERSALAGLRFMLAIDKLVSGKLATARQAQITKD